MKLNEKDNNHVDWHGKPYYSLDAFFKNKYGGKCYKIAVDAGCTCPNRDGRLDTRGCIFCSAGGSGDFSVSLADCRENPNQYIDLCIDEGVARFNKTVSERFVIYFQAFTNTYGDLTYLMGLWAAALESKRVVGISIATRPDCMGESVVAALREVKALADRLGKFVWIELGLQTIHRQSEKYIRRHYGLPVYEDACIKLSDLEIPLIVHIILGLPGETHQMIKETVEYVCGGIPWKDRSGGAENGEEYAVKTNVLPFGIKLQLLHVLEGTDLAGDYRAGHFEVLSMEEYIELVCDIVELIPEDVVIHRITGDGPKNILIAPTWSGNKKVVLNTLHKRMKERGVRQGARLI